MSISRLSPHATNTFELDSLIDEAGRRGFLWHQFRVDRHGPEVLAGVFQWPGRADVADVVVLADERTSHAYRTPTDPTTDVFAPTHVLWWYGRNQPQPGVTLVWILRALLTLPAPGDPYGTPPLVPAPRGTGVPGDRIPVRVRRRPGRCTASCRGTGYRWGCDCRRRWEANATRPKPP